VGRRLVLSYRNQASHCGKMHPHPHTLPCAGYVTVTKRALQPPSWECNYLALKDVPRIYQIFANFFPQDATATPPPPPAHWASSTSLFRSFAINLRHTTLGRTPLEESSDRRRNLYLTHNTTLTLHAHCGIRTSNLSKRMAADPRLRPRGHWDISVLGWDI